MYLPIDFLKTVSYYLRVLHGTGDGDGWLHTASRCGGNSEVSPDSLLSCSQERGIGRDYRHRVRSFGGRGLRTSGFTTGIENYYSKAKKKSRTNRNINKG